jgi:S1-C subfamily serine protease
MTSFHVVDGASEIQISFPDGRKGEAEIFRGSSDNDVVLLRTSIPTPAWLPLATASEIAIGTPAFTVGFPSPQVLGSAPKLTEGSVSSLVGVDESTMLQISIPIQGGNSGGPVVDHSGHVLGIVESIIDEDNDGTPMQLTNFARHARVASLLLPNATAKRDESMPLNRQRAIALATKAVCQIRTK